MGIGVEGEARGVVAQGSGEGFHIHAVLEAQGGEKVPHVMEADVLRANGTRFVLGGVWWRLLDSNQ